MKTKFSLIAAILFLFAANSFAQMTKECDEMKEDVWKVKMDSLAQVLKKMSDSNTNLQSDIDALKKNLNAIQSYDDCIKDLYTMVSKDGKSAITESDLANFRKAIKELEGKLDRNECPKENRQADLNALKQNKLSALPEFFSTVHSSLQSKVDKMECKKPVELYKVVPGDCLWCIAAREKYYGNGFAWPAIYNANKDKIKDPNLIFPNQEFKIPELTASEKAEYDKMRGNYKPAPTK